MDVSTLEVTHNEAANRFEIPLGEALAVLEYTLHNRTMAITHTGVPQPFEGRGVASRLTRVALEYARDRGYTVAPYCPFVARYMDRHPEFGALREAHVR
jgi:predicted GNAT family acetyltransferase